MLGDKGVVKRRKPGREYLYSPRARRERAGQSAMDKAVQTFFDGSLEKAVSSYLARRSVALTDEERQRLKKMIDGDRPGKRYSHLFNGDEAAAIGKLPVFDMGSTGLRLAAGAEVPRKNAG
ncbi:MAG: BlaI/MecI/CopY family transcriptional regulator [Phycisphaeraceae bacterium]